MRKFVGVQITRTCAYTRNTHAVQRIIASDDLCIPVRISGEFKRSSLAIITCKPGDEARLTVYNYTK